MQEPPSNQFPPPEAYTRQQQPAASTKAQVDYGVLMDADSDFCVPEYLVSYNEKTPELNAAVAAVMAEMDWVEKRGFNKFFNYAYATADDLRMHVANLIGKHGLSYEQHEVKIVPLGALIAVEYLFRVCHKSGEKGPFEKRTALARAQSEKGGADDKAISKANVLALKDWAKGRFSIPTGEDIESAGGDDPDADEYTQVKPGAARANSSAPPATQSQGNGKVNGGAMDNLRAEAAKVINEKAKKTDAEKAKDWANDLIAKIDKAAMEADNKPQALADLVTKPTDQSAILKLQANHKSIYDSVVRAFASSAARPHTGNLSSVFPVLWEDITKVDGGGVG